MQKTKPAFAALRRGEGKVKEKNKMKKLMIALAAVVSAVAVQAASVNWNFGIAAMDSSYGPAVGSVTISALASSWTEDFDGTGNMSFAISGSTDDIFATGTEWTVKTTATLWNEAMDTSAQYIYNYVFTMPALPSDDPGIQSALAAVADDINAALDPFGMGTLPTIEDAGTAGWTAASPVPEPTSGLMLLLGVAGLALKRRRA